MGTRIQSIVTQTPSHVNWTVAQTQSSTNISHTEMVHERVPAAGRGHTGPKHMLMSHSEPQSLPDAVGQRGVSIKCPRLELHPAQETIGHHGSSGACQQSNNSICSARNRGA